MDGLPIIENNPNLPYRTTTNFAHMCGHDGHMTTLISAAKVFLTQRHMIPKNKTIRLLF
jgi:hippurate hydrolase